MQIRDRRTHQWEPRSPAGSANGSSAPGCISSSRRAGLLSLQLRAARGAELGPIRSGSGRGQAAAATPAPPRERLRPCPAEASLAAKPGPRPSRARRGLGCSSPWAACTGCCARATTRSGWAPAPRCTWRPCWSTCRLRSWSWRATRRGTTRRRASSRGICSWPSATTRSSTSCWAASPSRRAASCPTSRPCCCPRRRRAPRSEAQPRAPAGPALPRPRGGEERLEQRPPGSLLPPARPGSALGCCPDSRPRSWPGSHPRPLVSPVGEMGPSASSLPLPLSSSG